MGSCGRCASARLPACATFHDKFFGPFPVGDAVDKALIDDNKSLHEPKLPGLRPLCLYRSHALRSLPLRPDSGQNRRSGQSHSPPATQPRVRTLHQVGQTPCGQIARRRPPVAPHQARASIDTLSNCFSPACFSPACFALASPIDFSSASGLIAAFKLWQSRRE